MSRYFPFLLLSAFSFFTLAESPKPAFIAKLAQHSLLLDIEQISDTHLVTVGANGHILLSADGANWRQVDVPAQSTLTAVFFINELEGWAVGHDAIILYTYDGGNTWEIQQYLPDLEKPLLDVFFKDKLNGLAIGSYGLFYRTTNGGKDWHAEFHHELLLSEDKEYLEELKLDDLAAYEDEKSSLLPHFNRLKLNSATLYMVGELGFLAKSDDFGQTWEKLDEIYYGSFFDLTVTKNKSLLLVGLRGHVYLSKPHQDGWQTVPSNTLALLNTIVLADDNRLFILGNNGTLLESIDGGKTFKQHKQGESLSLIDGVFYQQRLISVTNKGIKILSLGL